MRNLDYVISRNGLYFCDYNSFSIYFHTLTIIIHYIKCNYTNFQHLALFAKFAYIVFTHTKKKFINYPWFISQREYMRRSCCTAFAASSPFSTISHKTKLCNTGALMYASRYVYNNFRVSHRRILSHSPIKYLRLILCLAFYDGMYGATIQSWICDVFRGVCLAWLVLWWCLIILARSSFDGVRSKMRDKLDKMRALIM